MILGEPARRKVVSERKSLGELWASIAGPFAEFFKRSGAWLVLLFILVHKIGDTLANLTFRLLFDDLGFTNDEIAIYDVGVGFWALIVGVFVGGIIYAKLGLKRSVLIALVLMGVSNLSFALLAAAGHSNLGMASAIGFENFRKRLWRGGCGRLLLGAVRPALHGGSICVDLGWGERRRAFPYRNHCR